MSHRIDTAEDAVKASGGDLAPHCGVVEAESTLLAA
jgi:hypothetical protein